MAVISGYHVDDYCVGVFRQCIRVLKDRFGAEKVTDFSAISPGHLIARVPPKIRGEQQPAEARLVPIYRIKAVGTDFGDDGGLVRTGDPGYLYFEASACYLLDPMGEEAGLARSDEPYEGIVNCFDAREIGRVKEKHSHLDEDLKGILYRIPPEQLRIDT
jgi:hypothetical protein